MSIVLRNGIFRTLVFFQCVVLFAALYFSSTAYGGPEQLLDALQGVLLLGVAFYVAWLRRAMRAQVATHRETESELLRERHTLEKRVEMRTAELRTEVSERRCAEQLNRDRNRALEMLVRDEDTPKILQALTEAVAHRSTSVSCALHLLEGDILTLAAQSSLPSALASRLQQITTGNLDAPECVALDQKGIHAVGDLRQAHKPWSELLRANGAQSVWTAPIFAGGDRPLGTISVYSLLMHPPGESDFEFLQTSCQLASLILERQRMKEELIHRAHHDPLTGLGNRRLGKKGLESAIQCAQRDARGVAVLWIDLDKFKEINDTYGHPAGDFVLREMAHRLTARMRRGDTVAHMGGDEFMVVVECIEKRDDAEHVAVELLKILAQPIQLGETQLNVTASIGISMYPGDGDSAEVLEQRADLAMYDAKFGGLGLRAFSRDLIEEHNERFLLEAGMRHGLDDGAFSLVYQPQCLPSGKIASLEALLRFHHPQLGSVPPARFIPIAEETQLILPIGRWVLQEVSRQLRAWQQAGCEVVPIAVNISSIQFARNDFSNEVAEILAGAGVPPSLLELELTESLVMRDFAESARQMQRLKDLGVRIAIDDFGTGYSSLSYLHRLPIDILKIDRSFVEMITEPAGTRLIVDAVISMAQALGLRVVGEGVETLGQMEALREGGCDMLQGYLFSGPVPAEQALQFLRHRQLMPSSILNFPRTAA
ncbi:MAG: EAL domain-containing protein [Terracidiphilus sp.]